MRRSAPLLASPHAHTIAGIAALPRLLADRRLPCLFPVLLQGTLSFREFSGGFLRRHQTKNEPLLMDEFKAQDLANAAWAFAKLGQLDEKLCAALARATHSRMSEFKPQGLANTAWAFATLGQSDEKLFAALTRPT